MLKDTQAKHSDCVSISHLYLEYPIATTRYWVWALSRGTFKQHLHTTVYCTINDMFLIYHAY